MDVVSVSNGQIDVFYEDEGRLRGPTSAMVVRGTSRPWT